MIYYKKKKLEQRKVLKLIKQSNENK